MNAGPEQVGLRAGGPNDGLMPAKLSPSTLVRSFRQQVRLARIARVLLLGGLAGALIWAASLPEPAGRRMVFLFSLGGVLAWVAFVLQKLRHTQEVQASTILLATGQHDRAEQWLRNCLSRFSLSTHVKLAALQQLAVLQLRRGVPSDVVALCREVLRFPVKRSRSLWMNSRLMLTEGLLDLGQIPAAYEALRPVYDAPLSLVERMKLMVVQLRYELLSDHPESAAANLAEKVKLGELFPSPQAALVHALLAEACRRLGLGPHYRFLRERAALYQDLVQLAERYPVIKPILAG